MNSSLLRGVGLALLIASNACDDGPTDGSKAPASERQPESLRGLANRLDGTKDAAAIPPREHSEHAPPAAATDPDGGKPSVATADTAVGGQPGGGMMGKSGGGMGMDEPASVDSAAAEPTVAEDLTALLPASFGLDQSGAEEFFVGVADTAALSQTQLRALQAIARNHRDSDDRLRARIEARELDLAQLIADIELDRADVITALESIEELRVSRRLAHFDAVADALDTLIRAQRDLGAAWKQGHTYARLASPGQLTAGHASLAGQCEACHEPGAGATALLCMGCHATEPAVMARPETRFHADVTTCVSCHPEHVERRALTGEVLHHRLAEAAALARGREISGSTSPLEQFDCVACHGAAETHRPRKSCAIMDKTKGYFIHGAGHEMPTMLALPSARRSAPRRQRRATAKPTLSGRTSPAPAIIGERPCYKNLLSVPSGASQFSALHC